MKSALAAAALVAGVQAQVPVATPWPSSVYQQAASILSQLSFDQKANIVYGHSGPYVGNVPATPGLLPSLNYEDGPQGVADGVTLTTAWPSALTVASTWNKTSAYLWGQAMGLEQVQKGTNVMLGPAFNSLGRNPFSGRTFEYLGEDPHLAGEMAYAEVVGIQTNNISACIKHMFVNSVEQDRTTLTENMDTRVLVEFYMAPFFRAVQAYPGVGMCAYNRVNDTYSCEHEALNYFYNLSTHWLDGQEWGGYVQSDWGATHNTSSILVGLSQEMPSGTYFGSPLQQAIQSGSIPESYLDQAVTRILQATIGTGAWASSWNNTGTLSVNTTSDAHNTLARQLASESAILLKNNGILPLSTSTPSSILVIGDTDTVSGGGSGHVIPPYVITPFVGMLNVLNYIVNGNPVFPFPSRAPSCNITNDYDYYQPGNQCVGQNTSSSDPVQDCCALCAAQLNCVAFTYSPNEGCSGYKNDQGACWFHPTLDGGRVSSGLTAGVCTSPSLNSFVIGGVNVTFSTETDPSQIAELASQFDTVIVSISQTSSEGMDRSNLSFPYPYPELVTATAAVNPNTIVVAKCPGVCLLPFADEVAAILYMNMPGQEAGNAMADVLFGLVNPSGRLAMSIPEDDTMFWMGNPINPEQFPGVPGPNGYPVVTLLEGLNVGYRFFDSQSVLSPQFEFGFGLSYTQFKYSDLSVSGSISAANGGQVTVSVTVTNVGNLDGADVVQLYVMPPPATNEPPKKLRGFEKVFVPKGTSQQVTFTLNNFDVETFDADSFSYIVTPGQYGVIIAHSSKILALEDSFTVSS